MPLFETKEWNMHSGALSSFKIECDALTDEDIETLALIISQRFIFGDVYGVPNGGIRLANALQKYITVHHDSRLIVDDVLTTGNSIHETRFDLKWNNAMGVVIFARGPCPDWVIPIFQMWSE